MAISPSPFDRMPRRQRAASRPLVFAGVLVLVIVIGLAALFRQAAAEAFWYAAAPALRLRDALGSSQAAALRAQLASSSAAVADRDALYKENTDLKARLGRADTAPRRVLAAVLQAPPFSAYDSLVIDGGAASGIEVGDKVAAAGQALVGTVTEVQAHTARVELFSAPSASYQALLRGTIPVAVEGQGGGSLQALVPAGTQVAVGDSVQFPGLMGGIMAHVSAKEERPGESFIVIYMQLPANPQELQFVEVWKS